MYCNRDESRREPTVAVCSAGPPVGRRRSSDLVGVVQMLLQSRRLKFAAGLPGVDVLVRELETFKAKINIATGSETYEAWRERDHDDCVLALAIGCWVGELIAAEERAAAEEMMAESTVTYRTR
jgi:hypothetical protein